eukprot:403358342
MADANKQPVPPSGGQIGEEPKKKLTHSNISDFLNNEVLSDVTVVNPTTGAKYKAHKMIIASGSKYFLELFISEDHSKITQFEIPQPIPVSGDHPDDVVSKILKYFYHNQEFKVIKDEVTEANAPFMLSYAFVLKAENLKKSLEQRIVDKLLTPKNCTQYYFESIKFKSEPIQKACEALIVMNFSDITQKSDGKGTDFLKELPVDSFKSLCGADNLYIQEEKIVVDLIEAYMKHRENLPLLDEENPLKDWSNLTQEEKDKRLVEETKKKEEEKKKHDEEEKKQADEFAKLDELGKIQHKWKKKVNEVHVKALERLTVKRLTKAQKTDLFKTIRYSYLHHDELLSMTMNPTFDLAKNFIVEGLSVRLDTYESTNKKDLQINREPRVYYEVDNENNRTMIQQQQQQLQQNNPFSQMQNSLQQFQNPLQKQQTGMTNQSQKTNQLNNLFKAAMDEKAKSPVKMNKGAAQPYANYYERKIDEEREVQKDVVKKNVLGAGLKNMFSDLQKKQNQPSQHQFQQIQPSQHQFQQIQKKPQDFLSQSLILPQTGPKPPQKNLNQSVIVGDSLAERPTEFIYEHDFDENGALYFLGSYGKKKMWQNPHLIGQVQSFASSVGAGTVDNFVGRIATNCRTQNEPFSYFGVDLGEGRQLVPTCYTIRNRNSTTHVIMNWHLEGSNDKSNWIILDRRVYLGLNDGDAQLEEEQKHLKQKGVATTWGVDTDIYREIGFEGFRFFRIIQVGKNSSGSDNLALSGFEVYGKVVKGRWP